ncbi:optineurin-like isoform X2 [Leptidea sinapis]|uniref:optineurin-like isoform X2 n=1 Tax=Leptidea sinapis TaxID=189913 RepID=UPI0021C32A48|nr:optineurin-like isoform X2 [Leptidea sinapis]
MSSNADNEDDSFIIILESSPRPNMDVKFDTIANGVVDIQDTNNIPEEASLSLQSIFCFKDSPSPASMMIASTLVTEDRSMEELQKRFGELLDENVVLKETLKDNNDSMKEQFMLIASCQEDMLQTHKVYREKFDETRELVAKLRRENKKLKDDIALSSLSVSIAESRSGASSAVEFVTSPDDDVVEKLVAQLELVEKQRREVILENEKLTWQKESLEKIADMMTKERDDLKDKIQKIEIEISERFKDEIVKKNVIIKQNEEKIIQLKNQVKAAVIKLADSENVKILSDEITKRDLTIKQLQDKVTRRQDELKAAQIKILDLENIKLEFTRYKAGVGDMIKAYNEQINELKIRLKSVQTTVFQPLRFSVNNDDKTPDSSKYVHNMKLYDQTLKHLADYMNTTTNGTTDSLVQTLEIFTSLQEYKIDTASIEKVRSRLLDAKKLIEQHHTSTVNNVAQVKGVLSIFENIFSDYKELLKMKTEVKVDPASGSVEQLTKALMARGEEVQALQNEVAMLVGHTDDVALLKAQLESFRIDFEAEREGRAQMASERETAQSQLRLLQKEHQVLVKQLDEIRKMNPSVVQTALARVNVTTLKQPTVVQATAASATRVSTTSSTVTSNSGRTTTMAAAKLYKCPKCNQFSTDQYKVMEDHLDYCLDDF